MHSGEGDTDGDGEIYHFNLKGECEPCPENGPVFTADRRPYNLVHCDQLPVPSVSLVGLKCEYQPNSAADPYTGTVIVDVMVNVRNNMTGLVLDSQTGCADGVTLDRLVHMYVMQKGEHPITHRQFLYAGLPDSLGVQGTIGIFGTGISGGSTSGAHNKEQYSGLSGGKPACGGGTTPLEYDVYFRNEIATCSQGIIVSPWVLLKVRLKYPPGWTL